MIRFLRGIVVWVDTNLSRVSVKGIFRRMRLNWDKISMRDRVAFCIKTIHRPHSCAALIRSIYDHCGPNRPVIHVLDDGLPDLRFSRACPAEAAMVDQLLETEYDIGLSAGRNRLLDHADSPLVIFTDDDHLLIPETNLELLVRKLERNGNLDLLAGKSNQREGPRLITARNGVVRIRAGAYAREGSLARCTFTGNCFVAYRDALKAVRWDEQLKMEEHWDFFWRAKQAGLRVAVEVTHMFRHNHVDPVGYVRHRPEFRRMACEKYGVRRVQWH
jgi:GT2 family glycosyltransferase